MSRKAKVLVFVDWYLPGYKAGGPIRSVANLVERLDLDFSVVTSDRDHHTVHPYPGIKPNTWIHGTHQERVIYLDPAHQNKQQYRKLLQETDYDFIYINSLFSPNFALKPLLAIRKAGMQNKVLIAPRGMLKRGALSVKKNKKKLFLLAARIKGIYKGVRWHATNELEAEEIRKHFKGAEVRVAPNLISAESLSNQFIEKNAGKLKMASIARVSVEKNILGAIDYLLSSNSGMGTIEWDIYGTQENPEYLERCQKLSQQLKHVKVEFKGEIPHREIPEIMSRYHVFYLPTLGENFGHSIVESWLSGRPALISNRTPWHRLEEQQCGWDLPLEKHLFSEIINHCVKMDQESFDRLREGAATKAKGIVGNKTYVRQNYDLFLP